MRSRLGFWIRVLAFSSMAASFGVLTHASAVEASSTSCPATITLGCTYGSGLCDYVCSFDVAEAACQVAGGENCHTQGYECVMHWPWNGCDFCGFCTSCSGTYLCYGT
jgi:hypothetical protein